MKNWKLVGWKVLFIFLLHKCHLIFEDFIIGGFYLDDVLMMWWFLWGLMEFMGV